MMEDFQKPHRPSAQGFVLITLVALAFLVALAGCAEYEHTTDQKQMAQNEAMVAEANARIGMPNLTNFTERRFAKQILELRDEAFTTYTYFVDMNGRLHFVCESLGYGLPYSVQYTNPEYIARHSSYGIHSLPQADPNGLYMPGGLAATWIICSDGNGGIAPIYSEPELLVSPFPLPSVNGPPARGVTPARVAD